MRCSTVPALAASEHEESHHGYCEHSDTRQVSEEDGISGREDHGGSCPDPHACSESDEDEKRCHATFAIHFDSLRIPKWVMRGVPSHG